MCDNEGEKQCAICWEELSPSQSSVLLGCSHRFHYKCLAEWAKRSSQCPMCRAPFQEESAEENTNPTPTQELYVDFSQLHNMHQLQEDVYWWQVVCQLFALLSTSVTIIRFLALLFPQTVQRIFHPQIEAGKQLQARFSCVSKNLCNHIPTILLATYLCCWPLSNNEHA